MTDFPVTPFEPHRGPHVARLNWLRAGVLGANDGIVSIAALLVGVAAATSDTTAILIAGVAGLAAGSISMGLGEYVSVSSQRDSELSLIAKEKRELIEHPEEELSELQAIYEHKGLSAATAKKVAQELTDHDPIRAHLEAELNILEMHIVNPWHAALSSTVSFLAGATLPFVAIVFASPDWRLPFTIVSSIVALAATGTAGAYLGGSSIWKSVVRITIGGSAALAVTFAIGSLFNTSVG
ncbi:MAG: VIT family protein [Microbacteriaceae bacterium]|nr:VIT family protein [Microbacteriaceae bacterium]